MTATGFAKVMRQLFRDIGGTSAGAINALLLAGLGPPQEAKSLEVLQALADVNMFRFVDGDDDAQDFVRATVDYVLDDGDDEKGMLASIFQPLRNGAAKAHLAFKAGQVMDNLTDDLGLNPGNFFTDWLAEVLRRRGVETVEQLQAQMVTPPLIDRGTGKPLQSVETRASIGIVAADITTESKVVFPRMAELYWSDWQGMNPAELVRASMSIPGFFVPYRVSGIPQGPGPRARWSTQAGYSGELPTEVLFIDGGIMSNFPINLFHGQGVPRAPTLGVKLGVDRTKPRRVNTMLGLAGAVFDSARHCADYEFLHGHPDYKKLVTFIQTGDHYWLDFGIDTDGKVDLFRRGVDAAADFLRDFDWEAYKEVRRGL